MRSAHTVDQVREAARLVFQRLSLSDALYRDAERTGLVTLVGNTCG